MMLLLPVQIPAPQTPILLLYFILVNTLSKIIYLTIEICYCNRLRSQQLLYHSLPAAAVAAAAAAAATTTTLSISS
jgi:hypothetical protein